MIPSAQSIEGHKCGSPLKTRKGSYCESTLCVYGRKCVEVTWDVGRGAPSVWSREYFKVRPLRVTTATVSLSCASLRTGVSGFRGVQLLLEMRDGSSHADLPVNG